MREFAFELALCASLEGGERILSRQLGAHVHGRRVVDVLIVEPGDGLAERTELTPAEIPVAAIESDVGPGRARYWKDAFECHSERARRAVERAIEVGFFERDRRNGRTFVRQAARYPDWVDRLVAVENKPDLGRPGDLERQLRTDVSLALVDEVILATASYVTRAHLNRIPDAVGVWRFDPESGEREVVREATQLPVEKPGVELVDSTPGRTDVRIVEPSDKERGRRRLAERAYGKGWRSFSYPNCERCQPDDDGRPYCTWKDRDVRASEECGPDCAGHEPARPPDVDTDAIRAARTPWKRDPEGRTRQQVGLGQFEE